MGSAIGFGSGASNNRLIDTNASHYLTLACGSDLTAGRTLTFATGDASRTLTLSGNYTLNQDVSTSGGPTWNHIHAAVYGNVEEASAGGGLSLTSSAWIGMYTPSVSLYGAAGPVITVGNTTNSSSTDALCGQIVFTKSSGTNDPFKYPTYGHAKIAAYTDASTGDNDAPGRLCFYTVPDGSTTQTERMRIDRRGFVAINHTNPACPLHVAGDQTISSSTSAYGVAIGSTMPMTVDMTSYGIGLSTTFYPAISSGKTNSGYVKGFDVTMFRANASDYGTLTSLYGIYAVAGHYTGAQSSISTGTVWGCAINNYNKVGTVSGNVYGFYYSSDLSGGTTSGTHYGLYIAAGYAYYQGNSTWYTSDTKLKKDVARLSGPIVDKVKRVNGVEFKWDKEVKQDADDRNNYGFLAQEIEVEFPDLVMEHDEVSTIGSMEPEFKGKLKAINFNGMIPVLWEAVKELADRVEELEKK